MTFHGTVFEGHGHPYKHNIVQLDPTSNRRGPDQVETRQSKIERAFGKAPEPPVVSYQPKEKPQLVKKAKKATETTKATTKSVQTKKPIEAAGDEEPIEAAETEDAVKAIEGEKVAPVIQAT